jgi:hypothetical protein
MKQSTKNTLLAKIIEVLTESIDTTEIESQTAATIADNISVDDIVEKVTESVLENRELDPDRIAEQITENLERELDTDKIEAEVVERIVGSVWHDDDIAERIIEAAAQKLVDALLGDDEPSQLSGQEGARPVQRAEIPETTPVESLPEGAGPTLSPCERCGAAQFMHNADGTCPLYAMQETERLSNGHVAA